MILKSPYRRAALPVPRLPGFFFNLIVKNRLLQLIKRS
jgi:hypothetical protein